MNGTSIDQHVIRLRIIVLAMTGGVLALTIAALLFGGAGETDARFVPMMGAVLGVLGVGQVMSYFVVRSSVIGRLQRERQSDLAAPFPIERVLKTIATLTIIGAAMAEGFGLFGAVLLLITDTRYFLAAPVIAIVILLMQVPSRDRVKRWINELGADSGG